MGIISTIFWSFKKSYKLRKLQQRIAPPNRPVNDIVSDFIESFRTGSTDRENALEEYLDLCESDEGVSSVMKMENISREDLIDIYMRLSASGLGQWIEGHHAALSTIAYSEPLFYLARAGKQGVEWMEIVDKLVMYWENKIPQGHLLCSVT